MVQIPVRTYSNANNASSLTLFVNASDTDTDSNDTIFTPTEPLYSDKDLAFKPKDVKETDALRLELHPLPEEDGIIVSVIPPKQPRRRINHVPCDIVLVIDVSGSMGCEAPVPTENPSESERNGLSVLDLTKHAARTIIETLDENDRLAVVTFSTEAKVIQQLLPMTGNNKRATWARVEKLEVESMTNLWHGILEGIKMFDDQQRSNCAPAIMILTDGMPNHMCPQQGYVPKIRSYSLPATLHTFGFGYSLKSGLLKSIAEIGGGNYAFIPDAGMIGTVFVHSVANIQSTFATSVTLTLTTSNNLNLCETMGDYARVEGPKTDDQRQYTQKQYFIPLGSLQYGQSRNILLKYGGKIERSGPGPFILATLDCSTLDNSPAKLSVQRNIKDVTILPPETIQYHRTRANICGILSSMFPLSSTGEHMMMRKEDLSSKRAELKAVIHLTKSLPFTDEHNTSLLEDLCGASPNGQIYLALSSQEYFSKWGKHYLLSLLNAHQKQICNSFKDPGPLMYGRDSPLFTTCRDKLDYAFDNLPAPKPSNVVRDKSGKMVLKTVDVRKYNRRGNPCFAAKCLIDLGGGERIAVEEVRKGMNVWTPAGNRSVAAVVATQVEEYEMCRIGDLVVTAWHPVHVGGKWVFPNDISGDQVLYSGVIYSLLLEPDNNPKTHGVRIGGCLAVTLGHGLTAVPGNEVDARAHTFLGDHKKVARSLEGLRVDSNGLLVSHGMERDEITGLVSGFLPTKTAEE